ncbi:MAG TPA: 3-isopropylmalate dehydratase small subunit [Candidatus Limnocylindria bacterium]|jgi:3-isopropylmalate/(R)-2-methylmalate dehydratase small subunit|nr:3-isopropylmalate dehydratase small subunit [Candidatus Limnocylindria bacterium]
MEAVRRVTGRALPLGRADVDTDQIIPAHWLKRLERTGYGPGLFEAWRKDPEFVLNDRRFAGASIVLAGANFGSGSSREHAVWALMDAGYRAAISPRIADIFRNNALRNGFVPVEVDAAVVSKLVDAVRADPATTITIDVEHRTVDAPGVHASFALDDFSRTRLLEGLDDIAITLRHEREIAAYEARRAQWLPRVRTPA